MRKLLIQIVARLACYYVSIKKEKAVNFDGLSNSAPRLGGTECDTNNTGQCLDELFQSRKVVSEAIQEFKQVHFRSFE